MQGLAISNKGIEDITALEIRELLNAKTELKQGCVIFEIKNLEDLALLCYKGQSVNRVLLLLDKFKIKKLEDFERISKIDFSEWLKNRTFAARCEIIDNKELSSKEIEIAIGDKIDAKVNLANPDITLFAYIFNNDCYFGIDFSGDISKREYKVFLHRNDMKGTIAYALVRLSDFKEGIFLDPFCGSGTVAIEAALFGSNKSVNFYNKTKFPFLKFLNIDLNTFDSKEKETNIFGFDELFGHVKSSKNNAKVAGVKINFSKKEISWISEEFKEIDSIATNAPKLARFSNKIKIETDYKELFSNAKNALKKGRKIVICCNETETLKKFAENAGFKVAEERDVNQGEEILKIVTFLKL